jgi:hypothetical protein
MGGLIPALKTTSTRCGTYFNGESCLPVMVQHVSPAPQAWPVDKVQAGVVMPGKGGRLASGPSMTKPALMWYHWNIQHYEPCSNWHLLRPAQLALVHLGTVISLALGVTGFRQVGPY